MSVWTLLQVFVDLVFVAGLLAMWWRLRRPPQDDPRLRRGLQLLQTKITVLEDLSDRTDAQVKQLTSLLEHKARSVQNKILEAEQQIMKIDHSMSKSLEVAEIFQDKIPHQEILERQRTVEYVKAARMAHSGLSVEQISEAVHLPREQIELIAKFNRDQLMFDESALPEWATREGEVPADSNFAMSDIDFVGPLEQQKPEIDLDSKAKIENDFRQAVEKMKAFEQNPPPSIMDSKVAEALRTSMANGMETVQPAVMSIKATAQTLKDKLVSTAEDILRTPVGNQNTMAGTSAPATVKPVAKFTTPHAQTHEPRVIPTLKLDSTVVKKVIFPKIEKGP